MAWIDSRKQRINGRVVYQMLATRQITEWNNFLQKEIIISIINLISEESSISDGNNLENNPHFENEEKKKTLNPTKSIWLQPLRWVNMKAHRGHELHHRKINEEAD